MADYARMIDDCRRHKASLSDWDYDFINSLDSLLLKQKPLSIKQALKLEQIWKHAKQDCSLMDIDN